MASKVVFTVMSLHSRVLEGVGYKAGFYEKLLEASPVFGRANTSQDEPNTGHGWAHQQWQ